MRIDKLRSIEMGAIIAIKHRTSDPQPPLDIFIMMNHMLLFKSLIPTINYPQPAFIMVETIMHYIINT